MTQNDSPKNDRQDWENNESEELKMALDNIREQPLPMESLEKTLKAAEEIPMTTAAWQRGFLNMFLMSVPVFLVVGVLSFFLKKQIDLPWELIVALAGFGVMAAGFVVMLINQVRQNMHSVTVRVDCGPVPGRRVFQLQILMMAGFGLYFFSHGWQPATLAVGVGFMVASLFWAYMASSRLQFCEQGIRIHHAMITWDKIKTYQWKEGKTPTLLFQTRSKMALLTRGALPIPAESRSDVDQLLLQKLGHPEDAHADNNSSEN